MFTEVREMRFQEKVERKSAWCADVIHFYRLLKEVLCMLNPNALPYSQIFAKKLLFLTWMKDQLSCVELLLFHLLVHYKPVLIFSMLCG